MKWEDLRVMTAVYQVFRSRRYRLFQLENPQLFFQLLKHSSDQPWQENWNPNQFFLQTGPKEQQLSYGELSFLIPSIPLIHERLIDSLSSLLTPYGELLPMPSENGIYYAYHVLKAYDALDWERSITYRYPKSLVQIQRYEFQVEKVKRPLFFRLPHSYAPFFATESFLQRLNDLNGEGWQFEKCWESERE